MAFYISRQRNFKDNRLYVEVCTIGKSKSSPDKLNVRYEKLGENKLLVDPRDSINAAERIYKQWHLDYHDEGKQLKIIGRDFCNIYEFNAQGLKSARDWANKAFVNMTKCGSCNKAMGSRDPFEHSDLAASVFCSEICIATKYRQTFGVELPRVASSNSKLKGLIK